LRQERKQSVKLTIDFKDASEIKDHLNQIGAVMLSLMKKYRDEDLYPSPKAMKADFLKQRNVPVKHLPFCGRALCMFDLSFNFDS
jgi:hypothetical protein